MFVIRARSRLLQFGAFCMLTSFASTTLSETDLDRESCCVMDRDLKKLELSKGLIQRSSPLIIGGGVVRPGEGYICVLLSFDVDQTGRPIDIRVVRSFPHDRLVPNAVQSLRSYRFQQPVRTGDRPFLVLFAVDRVESGKR
jgi:hypothetical protein